MKQWTLIGGLVVAALGVATVIVVGPSLLQPPGAESARVAASGLPWQIEVLPDGGSRVMGLALGPRPDGGEPAAQGSTLADVRRRWGADVQIAIIAAPGEDGALEAFVDPAQVGFISGKLVVSAHVPANVLRGLRERAIKSEFMESTTRKYTLDPADEATALAAPVSALNFIPQAGLDEQTILTRFGTPAERVRSNGHLEHFLYPDRGLDVILDTEGKELIQYVAPARFERLRRPLRAASGVASGN